MQNIKPNVEQDEEYNLDLFLAERILAQRSPHFSDGIQSLDERGAGVRDLDERQVGVDQVDGAVDIPPQGVDHGLANLLLDEHPGCPFNCMHS